MWGKKKTFLEKKPTLGIQNKDFKTPVLNMLKELKGNMDKELKGMRKMLHE